MPSAAAVAQHQLQEAERELLKHLDSVEYHSAQVTNMQTKIARLRAYAGLEAKNVKPLVQAPSRRRAI